MNKKNIKLLGISTVALLAVAGAGLIGLPIVNQTQTWAVESEDAQTANDQLKEQLIKLETVKTQSAKIEEINNELATRFPNLPKGTDILQNISLAAALAGIDSSGIKSIAITAPTLLVQTAAEAEETPAAEAEGDAAAETPATDAAVDPNATPESATSNVASMEVSISIESSSGQVLAFAREFNNMQRTIKIKTTEVKGSAEDGTAQLSLVGVAYLYASITPPTEEAATDENATTDDSEDTTNTTN